MTLFVTILNVLNKVMLKKEQEICEWRKEGWIDGKMDGCVKQTLSLRGSGLTDFWCLNLTKWR